jgi:hypothetical protein
MLESTEAKKSINLKKIFRHDQHQHTSSINRKAAAHLNISSPILQHSTSIYSLVSPTRAAFTSIYSTTNSNELPYELYQPVSPPPPIPVQYNHITTPNSVSPAPRRQYFDFKEEQKEVHPLDLAPTTPRYDTPLQHPTQKRRNPPPMRNPQVRQTVATDIRKHNDMSETVPTGCVRITNRRHSCSSTAIYNDNTNNVVTLRKLRERRRSSKVGPTNAASSIDKMETSKSTPHHKVKTYNLRRAILSPEEVEKQKKIQELEDLITGRRGSTLKLTLTPKVLS